MVHRILNQKQEEAAEVLEESFVKIWEAMDVFDRSKGTLFTWMLAITRNSAIDKMRSNNRVTIQSLNRNVYGGGQKQFLPSQDDKCDVGMKDNNLKLELRNY